MKKMKFLTTNIQKSKDFQLYGFLVEAFDNEIIEVKDNDVSVVALHKAKDTNLNNIVVEDTALYIENSNVFGTDIKHVYEDILTHGLYSGEIACWKVALCAKKDDKLIISEGSLMGKIQYPPSDKGYHFEKFFAVKKNINDNTFVHYGELSDIERKKINPRFQAIENLVLALQNNDYSKVKVVDSQSVKEWTGDYQVEKKVKHIFSM